MSEYYAMIRSADHLMHYGVKGMKWGVRKAIEKGNSKRLARHYKKASKKLSKLNKQADVDTQKKIAKNYGKAAVVGASIGAASVGGMVGSAMRMKRLLGKARNLDAAHKALLNEESEMVRRRIRDGNRRLNLVAQGGKYNSYASKWQRDQEFAKLKKDFNDAVENDEKIFNAKNKALKEELDDTVSKFDRASQAHKISYAIGAAGLLGAGIAGSKAAKAKYRTTAKGHAKAVSERDTWKNEMANVFKGTKYQNLPSYDQVRSAGTKKKKRKSSRG